MTLNAICPCFTTRRMECMHELLSDAGVYITEDGSNHLSVNATIDQGITQRDNSFVY